MGNEKKPIGFVIIVVIVAFILFSIYFDIAFKALGELHK